MLSRLKMKFISNNNRLPDTQLRLSTRRALCSLGCLMLTSCLFTQVVGQQTANETQHIGLSAEPASFTSRAYHAGQVGNTNATQGASATWIWYPGDYEIWLAGKMQNRRTERGAFLPVFWKMDSHYVLVEFHKDFDLSAADTVLVAVEGRYNLKIDGKAVTGDLQHIIIPAGKHRLSLKVYNQGNVPAVFVKGREVVTDSSWQVTFEDKEWIDASGKASDKSGTDYVKAGYWNFDTPAVTPAAFKLPTRPVQPVKVTQLENGGRLLDFGKESFGYLKLFGIKGAGTVHIYYGESREEALSVDSCETLDTFRIAAHTGKLDTVTTSTKAFRYVQIQPAPGMQIDSSQLLFEYAALDERGSFHCSDTELNKIWEVSAYTLHLNTREFFIDGIKRDRWIWSGDAYQSYLMNYYLYFDSPTVKRTLFALRGKDPVTSHINTIMDYSFYWFMGIYDYYQYTADSALVKKLYPKMESLMNFCLSRLDSAGFMEGRSGDWVFIDWADNLTKQGALSFEQLLFCRSLETMSLCASLTGDLKNAAKYSKLAATLKKKLFATFWDSDKKAFIHRVVDGHKDTHVFRYTNMFALLLDYLDKEQRSDVIQHVLLNPDVQAINTPYMRFYELEALCAAGKQQYVTKEMKAYWGGMLKNGATSFWEQYDPNQKGAAKYAMYGRPFGKSLCHAWGASPIYLLGKYYLGVAPTGPGYQSYNIQPVLGGLEWMEGEVPFPQGAVKIYCSRRQIKVTAKDASGTGKLIFKSKKKPRVNTGQLQEQTPGIYQLEILPNQDYVVDYQSVE
ncbi:MAG TPA: hypothetical protein VL053_09240 [Arachidicoccus sp.]|nr:hypothetical protein [Arachidicoccus sp.]